LTAADGKRYATDCFAQDDIIQLIRVIPSPKTADFLDWFTYNDNTIDDREIFMKGIDYSYYYEQEDDE
jgi:hypothetical protein